ncbi:hypothetical protein H072_9174 [Dactylellina haptotyla CBS 200.50]|uniref:F-box domain-containing protein n=1 Tax=Dactylellina haptotyla (strain CBS 200.50) TaxID=1284197 RepID=S8A7T8_DACHA|nr:hypothetical protein H072_9174 [Dactylellina haptotyla CBS 200.50]
MATFATLPTELHREILSMLTRPDGYSTEDAISFSQCSNYCRDLALPLIFKRLTLSHAALNRLQTDSSLHHLCKYPRELNLFRQVSVRTADYRLYLPEIHRFHNLTVLRLPFPIVTGINRQLFRGIFNTIYSSPFYPNIKQLSFWNCRASTLPQEWESTPDDAEFLARQPGDDGVMSNVLDFKSLEIASIALTEGMLYSIDEHPPSYLAGSSENVYSLSRATAANLRVLHLRVATWVYPGEWEKGDPILPEFTTYENLEELRVQSATFNLWRLRAFKRRCPNLRSLKMFSMYMGLPTNEGTYEDLIGMNSLREVCLPAKTLAIEQHRLIPMLEQQVRNWIASGMKELEKAEFRFAKMGSKGDGWDLVVGWTISKGVLTKMPPEVEEGLNKS